jgi:arylsulfatase A-like enzyme
LSTGVELTARLAPPPPTRELGCDQDVHCWELTPEPLAKKGNLDLRGRDLLLITVDALRADHLSSYGYERTTTPHIDKLAEGGALFRYAYAATPHTSYSVTSLMTGKYMRPLLLQGAGKDSDTWAATLRTYGYRTAAFYPPAVFFIDSDRFKHFSDTGLGFEYRKVEFAEGKQRIDQVATYLKRESKAEQLFLWVHLFAPHEPYEAHPGFDFGDHDIDRYDSEVAFADDTVGKLVALFRKHRPRSAVMVSSDHGEEFGEHGGRYHGSSVYEEKVR